MIVGDYEDVARYEADDPAAVVAASFCCPWCLSGEVAIALHHDQELPVADCYCDACDRHWTVYLVSSQSTRLQVAPPTGVRLL